jgi:hypothetical protein
MDDCEETIGRGLTKTWERQGRAGDPQGQAVEATGNETPKGNGPADRPRVERGLPLSQLASLQAQAASK